MNTEALIKRCEKNYNDRLIAVTDEIISRNADFIMVTGASCSGKTTTTKKLRRYFALRGVHAETISLDDFYLDHEFTLTPDGKPDYETINSLDLPLLDSVMCDLAAGRTVRIPRFDFNAKRRSELYEELSLDSGEVVIIEGLHALNPLLCAHVDAASVYRIYLYADDSAYDVKLLRRIVRDAYYRGSDARLTLSMWDDVLNGEEMYIKPYISTADAVINTFFDYETGLLAPEGIKLLSSVPADCPEYAAARALAATVSGAAPIAYDDVPSDSLMNEFIKKK